MEPIALDPVIAAVLAGAVLFVGLVVLDLFDSVSVIKDKKRKERKEWE